MFRDEFKKSYTTIPFAVFEGVFQSAYQSRLSHQHKEIELIVVQKGAAVFWIGDERIAASAGDVLVIPPYALHRLYIPDGVETAYLGTCFDAALLWDKKLTMGLEGATLSLYPLSDKDLPYTPRMADWIEKAYKAYSESKSGWEMEVIGYLSLFFSTLKANDRFFKRTAGEAAPSFAEKAARYVSENYAAPITSATAATYLFMNNSYFCRLFKQSFGCCFTDYVTAYRLERAALYLRDTRLPITEIAFRSGFRNSSYFGQAFKKSFGLSPIAYRKKREDL